MKTKAAFSLAAICLAGAAGGCDDSETPASQPAGPVWTAYQEAAIPPPLTVIDDYDDIPAFARGPE
ncbi:MAG: hypothetical protein AAF449_17910, partial [Myxococcota bacterium]